MNWVSEYGQLIGLLAISVVAICLMALVYLLATRKMSFSLGLLLCGAIVVALSVYRLIISVYASV